MRKIAFFSVAVIVVQFANAVDCTLEAFERTSLEALTNSTKLCSSAFSNLVDSAVGSTNENLTVDGYLMRGIRARHMFFETAEVSCLREEFAAVSNAFEIAGGFTNNWRKWSSCLMRAGCYASEDSFNESFELLTNGLRRMSIEGFVGTSNELAAAMLNKFEMRGASLPVAYKIMAGMSAAELGLRSEAQAYALQVPSKFAMLIGEVLKAKSH